MNIPKLRFKEFSDEYSKFNFDELADYKKGPFGSALKKEIFVPKSENSIKVYEQQNAIKKDWTLERYFITKEYYEKLKAFTIKPGDIIVSCAGTIGEYYVLPSDAEIGIINQALMRINTNKIVNQNYFLYVFDNMVYNFSKTFSNGSAIKNIPPFADFKKQVAFIPTIEEQNKVSNFLSMLDKKIELQNKKIEDLKLFKSYTKNQLFSSGEKVVKLKDILIKWNKKNKDGSIDYVESISNKYGFISQSDQFEDRNVASKDLKNYYVIKKNVFGYNPSRLNVGSLALKENDNTSVVSPLYECFTTTQNNKFMLEWFDSKYFKKGTLSKFEGGVRNTLNFTNLCEIEINLPCLDKQNEFANYLYSFDKKIQLEELKLNRLNEMKKGLMQSMFV